MTISKVPSSSKTSLIQEVHEPDLTQFLRHPLQYPFFLAMTRFSLSPQHLPAPTAPLGIFKAGSCLGSESASFDFIEAPFYLTACEMPICFFQSIHALIDLHFILSLSLSSTLYKLLAVLVLCNAEVALDTFSAVQQLLSFKNRSLLKGNKPMACMFCFRQQK